ncbi:hypothetical protein [Streptomyces antibioticus]|uniref:hypothetical protein n=1 Tax=Streptomyces antibioticus TaxID=1890 RepID=UPI0033C850EC
MTIPGLTPTSRVGDPRCGSRDTDDSPTCGAPAAWHVAWHFKPEAKFSLLCDQHLAEAQTKFVYADRHPAEIVCDMPGTGWAREDPSFCVIPSDEFDRTLLESRGVPSA